MGHTSLSDDELVELACAGQDQAFEALVCRHQDNIYNAAYYLVGNHQDAQDIAQDVFVKAYGSIVKFRRKSRFGTWLFGIMLNTVRSFWRKRSRTDGAVHLGGNPADEERGHLSLQSGQDGPLGTSLRLETVQMVRSAIEQLEEELREILVLREIQGLAYEDIAALLRLPLGTVKSRLFRARYALKEELEPFFGTESD